MERVAAWMHWPIVTVAARTRVADAQRIAAEHGVRHLVVIEADDMVGVLCTCDLRTAKPDDRVGDRMSRRVRTVEPGAALETAADVMRRSDVGCLPVTVSGKLVGMLTRGDLRRAGFPDPALSD